MIEIIIDEWKALLIGGFISSMEILAGSLLGLAFGNLFALIAYSLPKVRALILTIVSIFAPIPVVFYLPFSISLFGFGIVQVTLLVALLSTLLFVTAAYTAFTALPRAMLDIANVYRLSSFDKFRMVLLPYAIPSLGVAFRIALAFSWVVAYIGEVKSSDGRNGLGAMTKAYVDLTNYDYAYVCAAAIAFFAIILDQLSSFTFAYFSRWQPIERGAANEV
ncbi:ABC transporter permease subunit [Altererythrobacter luteolus]|uniref:ABC transporter permease subunit n=1 Tax=Pontixanthobacter luteolus TaxID=295089 RepID=A0A6I4V676_9SPHN|nr:ABC transporter permease subunit [Pontixanthobacter luteolus]MXP47432.1 ABC transporter permease subunit [Pontixanthobacter luteolus]